MSRAGLSPSFFDRSVVTVARDLLGRRLIRLIDGHRLGGRIVETEAYGGVDDPASHARGGPTDRCRVMFGPPGVTYVYLVYGMHHCLNLVCEAEGRAAAVLIRAMEPEEGLALMQANRASRPRREWAAGPGRLCMALAIDLGQGGLMLPNDEIRIERGAPLPAGRRVSGPRIGVGYAGEAAGWRWRFHERDSPFVSAAPAGRLNRRSTC